MTGKTKKSIPLKNTSFSSGHFFTSIQYFSLTYLTVTYCYESKKPPSSAGELTNFTVLFWINIGHNPSNNFLLALEYAARIQCIPFLACCGKIQLDSLTF